MKEETPIESVVIRYFEDDCTQEELSELTRWLDASPDNRTMFREMKAVYDSGREPLSEFEVDVRWDNLWKSISAPLEKPVSVSRRPRRPLFRMLRYAAVILVGGLGGFVLQHYLSDRQENPVNEVWIEAGNKSTVTLSDGTRVTLKSSSTLKYPSRFGRQREVWLDGEAFFEVAEDPEVPFTVRSRQQAVRVHGTSFNVQAYPGDACNTVTLLSGSVSLEVYDKQGNRIDTRRMEPYEQYRFDPEKGLLALHTLDDVDKFRSWTDGIYRFREERLAVVAGRLEHYYGVRIRIGDEQIKNELYTGSFPLDQPIAEVLDMLNYERRFTVKTEGRNFAIEKK